MSSIVSLDTAAIDKIEKQFKVLDRNGDGLITIAEMRKSLNAAGEDYTLKDVQNMMKKGDKDGDGRLAWEEFLDMMRDHCRKDTRESIKSVERKEATSQQYDEAIAAFKVFDRNNDGMIDIDELQHTMEMLNLEEDPAKVDKLFQDLDKDGSGQIDYSEFGRLIGL